MGIPPDKGGMEAGGESISGGIYGGERYNARIREDPAGLPLNKTESKSNPRTNARLDERGIF